MDTNAPDLYIPLMAFITFLLLKGYALMLTVRFTPEDLGITASSSMLWLFCEILLVKFGFWLIEDVSPGWLDLVAFLSYKYVGLILDVMVGLVLGRTMFYLTFFVSAFSSALFTVRTINPANSGIRKQKDDLIDPTIADSQMRTGSEAMPSKRTYFLALVGLLQIVVALFLVQSVIPNSSTLAIPFASSPTPLDGLGGRDDVNIEERLGDHRTIPSAGGVGRVAPTKGRINGKPGTLSATKTPDAERDEGDIDALQRQG